MMPSHLMLLLTSSVCTPILAKQLRWVLMADTAIVNIDSSKNVEQKVWINGKLSSQRSDSMLRGSYGTPLS